MKISIRLIMAVQLLFNSCFVFAQVKRISFHSTNTLENVNSSSLKLLENKYSINGEVKPSFYLPLSGYKITSVFGWRRHPITGRLDFHQGIDLISKDKIARNIMQGKVMRTGFHKNLGNYVQVDHGHVQSVYGHLSVIMVKVEQNIPIGYPIGITGSTGRVTGEHLHFGIKYNGIFINPWQFLQSLTNTTTK